jgi:hypothetical protein
LGDFAGCVLRKRLLNNEDDDGFGWSALHHASDPALATPGARVIADTERIEEALGAS